MNHKQKLIAAGRRWHRLLTWPAMLAMLVFMLSASMHILVTWTGPQTAINKPPQQIFDSAHGAAIPAVLHKYGITQASIIRLVPSSHEPLLQVTGNPMAPRRYFSLATQEELPNQDEQQARWLADYYLDDASRHIVSVRFQTVFDDDYPWVNRLLPVYKVVYEGDDGLTLYVHTETLMLANISNHWKCKVQTVFRQLHTWQWLDSWRHGRVILMMLLLCSLLAMMVAGFSLLYLLRRNSKVSVTRRAHRILAHMIGIPLLGFTASGIYHLLHSEYANAQRDFNLSQPLVFQEESFNHFPAAALPRQALHSISLVQAGGRLFYRASVVEAVSAGGGEHDHHGDRKIRQQRFDGIPKERGGIYIPLTETESAVDLNDEIFARQLAMDYLFVDTGKITNVERVTHFGPDYDFRNKRLPVWRVEIDNPEADVLFIDVASGVLVDRINRASRMEGYSFSFLHKWNFLTFPLGREKRDALIVLVLLCGVSLAALGLKLKTTIRQNSITAAKSGEQAPATSR